MWEATNQSNYNKGHAYYNKIYKCIYVHGYILICMSYMNLIILGIIMLIRVLKKYMSINISNL